MELFDYLSLFASIGMVAYAGLVALALLMVLAIYRRRSMIRRAGERQAGKKLAIRTRGRARRESLAVACQRRNIKELAAIVKRQLRLNRRGLPEGAYHQALVLTRESVAELRFDRLYGLHCLLSDLGQGHSPAKLDSYFQQET